MLLPWLACPSLKYSGLWAAVKYNPIMFSLIRLSPVVKLVFLHALMPQGANRKREIMESLSGRKTQRRFVKFPLGRDISNTHLK